MLELTTTDFVKHSAFLRAVHDSIQQRPVTEQHYMVEARSEPALGRSLAYMRSSFESVGNVDAVRTFSSAIECLEAGDRNWQQLGQKISSALHCLEIERLPSVFVLNTEEVALYERAKSTFSDAVRNAFPEAMEDLEEAGLCLAFNRNTAAVFHLMRGLERILRSLGVIAGADVADASGKPLLWAHLTESIQKKVNAMPLPQRESWNEVLVTFSHVRTSWRNPTMHPEKTYTFESAKGIYAATQAFADSASRAPGPDSTSRASAAN